MLLGTVQSMRGAFKKSYRMMSIRSWVDIPYEISLFLSLLISIMSLSMWVVGAESDGLSCIYFIIAFRVKIIRKRLYN